MVRDGSPKKHDSKSGEDQKRNDRDQTPGPVRLHDRMSHARNEDVIRRHTATHICRSGREGCKSIKPFRDSREHAWPENTKHVYSEPQYDEYDRKVDDQRVDVGCPERNHGFRGARGMTSTSDTDHGLVSSKKSSPFSISPAFANPVAT